MENYQSSRLKTPTIRSTIYSVLISALIGGCSQETGTQLTTTTVELSKPKIEALGQRLLEQKARRSAALKSATDELSASTRSFLERPDVDTQRLLQAAWGKAHKLWLEVSYLTVPLSLSTKGLSTKSLSTQSLSTAGSLTDSDYPFVIDAWPVTPGFIDSLPEYESSGIVNDETIDLTPETVAQQHGITSEDEVALGFHVLEYYAYSRDLADFAPTAINADRRIKFIKIVLERLAEDIEKFEADAASDVYFSDQVSVKHLLMTLRERNKQTLRELSLPGEHGDFSQTSGEHIQTQLQTLASVLQDTGLNTMLVEVNPVLTKTLGLTLKEALAIANAADPPTEASASMLLRLVSGISQELAEFESAL